MQHPWRTALVTGASSGIGEAFARVLAEDGVALTLVARRTEQMQELASELEASGTRVDVVGADLSTAAGRAAIADRLRGDGAVDLLVNNAGLGAATGFVDGDADRYREI